MPYLVIWSSQCSFVPLNTGLSTPLLWPLLQHFTAEMLQKKRGPQASPQNLFVSLGSRKRI